jgi:PERQ amino acid-rich with GYF domain-containing protein
MGNAWTTVGSGGKTTPAAVVPRPAPAAYASTASGSSAATSRPNGTVLSRPPQPPQPVKASSSTKAEDPPVPPSHEFLKWLTDSLKGLNSTVNCTAVVACFSIVVISDYCAAVEEIMSMLLSFPMDPDPTTVEIISDLIYANSTVLNGRRFASEYISKRKADAASRPQGVSPSGGVGKPVSIADVVKAQPKSAQPEWGGFKVVNKKRRGGRP